MGFRIRVFSVADLSCLVDVLNRANEGSYEFIPLTVEALQSWLEGGRLQILIAEEDGRFLGTTAYHDGHWGEEIEWLVVTEPENRRITERRLVAEAEKLVKNKRVFVSVDSESPKIDDWIQLGYKTEGGLYHLTIMLDHEIQIPRIDEHVVLRGLRSDEEDQFIQTINAGFESERLKSGTIKEWKSESSSFDEDWIHVAESEGKIVSAVVAKLDLRHNAYFGTKRGYLGPAATLPEYRRKNIVTALTCRAMNFLHEKGLDSVALYTSERNTASISLLQKLGFRIMHHWKFMRKTFPDDVLNRNLFEGEN